MKLYTEEGVKNRLNVMFLECTTKTILNSLTPIELPSDEDIENVAKISCYENDVHLFSWGAKWIKEQILNQKK